MRYLIYIIILICFLFIYLYINTRQTNNDYIHPSAIVLSSNINNGGRGVFATKKYKKGDVIEICPCVKTESELIGGRIDDYSFTYDDTSSVIALGYCSIYNHSDNFNGVWTILDENRMEIIAKRDILVGEEIFISYGDEYWEARGHYLDKND